MAVTTFGGTGSAFADSKMYSLRRSTMRQYSHLSLFLGDLTGATGKKAESVVFDYLNEKVITS